MTTEQILISIILFLAMLMFGWGRWRYDLVAMSALLIAVVVGIVPANNAFEGFGHPAVVTVAAVLIISGALKNAGVVDEIAGRISHLTETPILHIAVLTLVVTVASAFMNNVGALALMLPIALSTAQERERSPALILMPLAFGSLLGGMTTLIGTPPNIIIANIRADYQGEPFGMFDFAPVGLPVAIVGFIFITVIGWRLIPKARLQYSASGSLFEVGSYLTEARVSAESKIIGKTLGDIYQISEQDVLILRADPSELRPFLDTHGLELMSTATPAFIEPDPDNDSLAEGIVSNDSELIGKGVEFLRRKTARTVALVGLARNGHSVTRRLRQQQFRAGDVLLLRGDSDTIHQQFSLLGLWPLATRSLDLNRSRRVLTALLIFAFAIALGIIGVVSLPIAFLIAIMIYLANSLVVITEGLPVPWVVTLILVVTMLLSDVINNAATALVMAPLSIAMAEALGVNVDPFLMAVAVGASCAFLTPIGHQCNTLVMGPGGYEFSDYWRMGLPLEILIVAISVPAILFFWPL